MMPAVIKVLKIFLLKIKIVIILKAFLRKTDIAFKVFSTMPHRK